MKNLLFAAPIMFAVFYASSCKKESSTALSQYTDAVTCNETDDNLNTYSQKISTILNNSCATAGCHDAVTHESGKDYSSFAGAKAGMDATGYCSINHGSGCKSMPRSLPKLTDAEIHDLTCWAKNNYPN